MKIRLATLIATFMVGPACLQQAHAQAPAATPAGTRVDAVVHDSIAGKALGGATVQIVSATDPMAFSRTADTDSNGVVAFEGVPPGRYAVGFMHPLLDAIGIAPPTREVVVDGSQPQRVDLAIPSPGRLRVAVCGPAVAADSSGVFIGSVRDPRDGTAIGGATVTGRWLEVTFGAGGITQRIGQVVATTGPDGWFALCRLPVGTVTIVASSGTDSISPVDLQVEPSEFRRSDLYIGAAGVARLSGRVVTEDSGRAVAAARVSVEGGPTVETDGRGEWTLANAPLGTRMLEVRAIGYYPDRRPVNVVVGAEPLELGITTFKAVLDAVRVTANRIDPAAAGGFAERQRGSGMGRYLDAQAIARRNPIVMSDVLRTMPGFIGDGTLAMKGNFSDRAGNYGVNCAAEVYVDGHLMRGISASELDALVDPRDVSGLEVYSAGSPKPAQFDSGMSGCGSLVIWQKPMSERIRRR